MFTMAELEAAHRLVSATIQPSPAHAWPLLGELLGAETIVKHENHNPTGAFKARGGLVYMDRLKRERPDTPGVVSATTGNHGQSLAHAGGIFAVPVTIVAPRGNSPEKNAAMRGYGAELIEHGADFDEAADHAQALASERGLERAPSFHRNLVLGVSTYARELFAAVPDLDILYVPIGLGSGICGCIMARDLMGLKTEIVGVQAKGAPAYALSFTQGKPVSTNAADTFAEGIATRRPDEEALAIILKGVSRIVTVSDEAIAGAVVDYWRATHNLAEGAGAAPLAAAKEERDRLAGKKVGLVLSGGNMDLEIFRQSVLSKPLKNVA